MTEATQTAAPKKKAARPVQDKPGPELLAQRFETTKAKKKATKKAPKKEVKKAAPAPKSKKTLRQKSKVKRKAKKVAKSKAKSSKSNGHAPTRHHGWDYNFTEAEVVASFAKNLMDARAESGMTQQALADAMNYTRIAVCNMERGVNGCTLPTLLRLCSVLKTSPGDLLRKRS